VWQHDSGASLVRTTHYSLPKDLHAHVEVAQPTTSFALFRRMGNTHHFEPEEEDAAPSLVASAAANGTVVASTGQVVNASCNVTITPQCLYDLYNIHYTGSARTKNSIATANYLEEYVNFTDLNTFYKTYVPGAVGSPKPPVYLINGGLNNQSDPGGEAALDAQYAFGLAYPAKPIVYSTGGMCAKCVYVDLDRLTSSRQSAMAAGEQCHPEYQ
jgi:tripeptidyl-peptidase-1